MALAGTISENYNPTFRFCSKGKAHYGRRGDPCPILRNLCRLNRASYSTVLGHADTLVEALLLIFGRRISLQERTRICIASSRNCISFYTKLFSTPTHQPCLGEACRILMGGYRLILSRLHHGCCSTGFGRRQRDTLQPVSASFPGKRPCRPRKRQQSA